MARGSVVVRDAEAADAAALVHIWEQVAGSVRSSLAPTSAGDARRAILRLDTDPSERLLVAEVDDVPVGVVHLRRQPLSPIHDEDAVHVSSLHVLGDHRRRGVGSALLTAAVDWAEEKDTDHLVASVAASARDSNRFLARLGMGQVAVVRATTTAGLRARLVALTVKANGATTSPASNVVAVRRLMRRSRATS